MKKLMVVAAVALAAVSAQAAKFSWNFASEVYVEGENVPTADMTGYTAYLVSATDWAGADATDASSIGTALGKAIASAAFSDWNDNSEGYNSEGNYTYNYYQYADSPTGVDVATGDDQNYMIVFDNGKKFYATAVTGDIMDDDDKTQGKSPFFDVSLALDTANFTSYGVPEPTSGLMLLVGLAGLALKRKRA